MLKTQFSNFGINAISANAAEVNYLVGVTSAVQTQLNTLDTGKASKSGAATPARTTSLPPPRLCPPSHRRCNDQSSQHCVCFATVSMPPCQGRRGMAASSSRPMGRTPVGRTSTARRQSSAPTPTPSMAALCAHGKPDLTLPATPRLVTWCMSPTDRASQPASLTATAPTSWALRKT